MATIPADLKIKAFDKLVKILQGNERLINSYVRNVYSHSDNKVNPNQPYDDPIEAHIKQERVEVYEWRLRAINCADIEKALMALAKDSKD